jgi:CubicO group peptidase (beta-lactamase class C family)
MPGRGLGGPVLAAFLMAIALAACSSNDDSSNGGSNDGGSNGSGNGDGTAPPEDAFGEVSRLVEAFVANRGLSGAGLIVVDRDDGVVHEEYWGAFDAERISLVASASKMLSAGVLLRLDDEGLVDVDAPIADIVEWGSGNPDITLAQLLSNSSGLVGIFPDPAYGPYLCQYLPVGTLQDCASSIFLTADDDADVIPPDTQFRYGGGQWQVAGAVAEAASGRSWAELLEETYVQPCGLAPGSLGYNNPITQMGNGIDYPIEFGGDPSTLVATDNPNIESGAYAKPTVLAQLLLAYLRGGECGDGQRILSEQAIERMLGDRVATSYGGNAAPGVGYGLGWWVNRRSGLVYSTGAYGAVPTLQFDEGYGYYIVLEANDATWQALAAPLAAAIEAAVLASRG